MLHKHTHRFVCYILGIQKWWEPTRNKPESVFKTALIWQGAEGRGVLGKGKSSCE